MLVTFKKEVSLFEEGLELHRQGKFAEAEQVYRRVLAQDPRHFDSLHMLGLVSHQLGRTAEGVAMIEKALEIIPSVAIGWSNLAELKRLLGRLPEAEAAARRSLALDPNNSGAYTNLAMIMNNMGRWEEGMQAGLKSIELAPREVGGYAAAGCALAEMKRPHEALPYLEEAMKLNPNDLGVVTAMAGCAEMIERNDVAYQMSKKAASLAPDNPQVQLNTGALLLRLEKFAEARAWFEKMLERYPNWRIIREYYAVCLHTVREFDRSIALTRELIAETPDRIDMYPALGESLMGVGRFDECVEEMKKAMMTRPLAGLNQTLSNALVRTGRLEEGLAELDRGIALDPNNAVLHFNRAIILLLMGRLKEAWGEYEWRWQHPRMVGRTRAFRQPKWNGEKLTGQRVLLHAEQGIGDTIFFGRYATLLAERGGVPIVFCQDSVEELVKTIKGVGGTVGENKPFPPFDLHCAIMSLPGVFGTTLENIPTWHKYISANAEKSAYWKEELARRTKKLKVGLVWEGGHFQPENYLRSASLPEYAALGEVEGVAFFGLQKGPAEVQSKTPPARMDFTDLGPFIKDFSDTAAILDNMDLLISIDTSVIHVAAALGKPVWMFLAYSPGHMWMLQREDTPWYPTTVRIFRQNAFQDWATPVNRVKGELEKWVREQQAARG